MLRELKMGGSMSPALREGVLLSPHKAESGCSAAFPLGPKGWNSHSQGEAEVRKDLVGRVRADRVL
jgi:hypothetical protein